MIADDAAQTLLSQFALRRHGAPPGRARGYVLMLHGRGASAESILDLADAFALPDLCFLAPQAQGNTWYPLPFIAPLAANEPHLSRALATTAGILEHLEVAGVPAGKIGICGFSQGACLATETAIRNPRAYGAVIGYSGGYIGPLGPQRQEAASLAGAQVFLGCSDVDPHIPLERVHQTTTLMRAMGATVDERIYPGFGHGINHDELNAARALLAGLSA